jgi:hypothetical protein
MEKITNNLPDAYFYYGLSVTSVIALIWVLRWVGGRLLDNLDKLGKDVSELKAGQQIQTQILKGHNEDIQEIKQKVFFTRYKEQDK